MIGSTLKGQFAVSGYVTLKNIEGVDHEDSLAQPKPAGNCANWVLGHMVKARNGTLGVLGQKPFASGDKFAAYGNEPIRKKEQALPWNELVDLFKSSQAPLEKALETVKTEDLAKPASFSPTGNPNETVGSLLASLAFHEAYHAGQLGLLRRLGGREGTVRGPETAKA